MNFRFVLKYFTALAGLIAVFALAGGATLMGQATDGNLVGTVSDPSGAVVAGATVELTNTATGVTTTTKTNVSGEYRFNNIPPGKYDLKTRQPGFSASTVRALDVSLGKTSTANVTLAVGEVSTTVEVTDTAALIDTTTAQVAATFGAREA